MTLLLAGKKVKHRPADEGSPNACPARSSTAQRSRLPMGRLPMALHGARTVGGTVITGPHAGVRMMRLLRMTAWRAR